MFSAGISVNATVDYTCIKGGWSGPGGTGNISSNPMFIDANGADNIIGTEDDNLRLNPPTTPSPCIDVGSNDEVPGGFEGNLDLDRVTRILDGDCDSTATVDMGAYEVNYVCP